MATASALQSQMRWPYQELPPRVPMRRFTVEEYHRLLSAGFLREGERTELFEGWLVEKMTLHPPHVYAVNELAHYLLRTLSEKWVCRPLSPITLPSGEPEPDIAVVRGPRQRYARIHPKPIDVALLVEVADDSLQYDRELKLPVYARNRISVYWIVNLIDGRVEVYTHPRSGKAPTYQQHEEFGLGATVPIILDGNEIGRIAVNDLVPSH